MIERERIERQTQPRLAAPVLAGTVSTTACMGACPLMRPHLIVLVHLSIVVAPEGKRLREASASPKSRTYSRKPPRESRGGKLVLKLVAAAGARCTLDQCNEQEPLASRDPRGLHSCRYAPDRGHETMSAPSIVSGISVGAIKALESTAVMSTTPQNPMVTLSSFAMISRQSRTPASPIAPKP